MALLGENGAGKTTLMNILFGHYVADAGAIEVVRHGRCRRATRTRRSRAGIGMVHQHFTLADNLTVLDNIVLGTEPLWRPGVRTRRRRAARIARARRSDFGLAVDPDAPGRRPVGRRAAARRDPEGALSRRAHPDPRRADGGADAAGDRGAVRDAADAGRARGSSIIFISPQAQRGDGGQPTASLVLRARQAGRRAARRRATDRAELAALMVGRDALPEPPMRAGAGRRRCSTAQRRDRARAGGRPGSTASTSTLRGRRDHRHRRRLRQRPGGARRLLAGTDAPADGAAPSTCAAKSLGMVAARMRSTAASAASRRTGMRSARSAT